MTDKLQREILTFDRLEVGCNWLEPLLYAYISFKEKCDELSKGLSEKFTSKQFDDGKMPPLEKVGSINLEDANLPHLDSALGESKDVHFYPAVMPE